MMTRFNWWIRRNAEWLAIVLAVVGLSAVIVTEPSRSRHFTSTASRG